MICCHYPFNCNFFVGNEIKNISCLAADNKLLYVSSENVVYSVAHGINIRHTLNGSKSPIKCLLPFEDFILAANEVNEIILWHLESQGL